MSTQSLDLFGEVAGETVRRSAVISPCGAYRYALRRWWSDEPANEVCFVMLNPSTADALVDDPTVKRCVAYARAWGHTGMVVRNLFAYRATNPNDLLRVDDPVGPDGNEALAAAMLSQRIVVAWGAFPHLGRVRRALEILQGKSLWCLGTTQGGMPRHPLYLRSDQTLEPYPNATKG